MNFENVKTNITWLEGRRLFPLDIFTLDLILALFP